MKIVFLDTPAFAKQDMIDAFEENEIQCDLFSHPSYQDRVNASLNLIFLSLLNLTTTVLYSPLIIFRFCQTAVKNMGYLMFPMFMTVR